jgi:hypothetical protein
MSVTTYGLEHGELEWQSDFQASQDNKGKWEASISFICFLGSVAALVPAKGASCVEEGWGFLVFDSCSVSNI